MKKFILFAALAAVLFCSCEKEEVIETYEPEVTLAGRADFNAPKSSFCSTLSSVKVTAANDGYLDIAGWSGDKTAFGLEANYKTGNGKMRVYLDVKSPTDSTSVVVKRPCDLFNITLTKLKVSETTLLLEAKDSAGTKYTISAAESQLKK